MDQEPRLSCRNLFGVLRGHGSFGKARKRWSPRIGRKNPSGVHKSGENKLPRWQSAQSRCLLHRPCPQTGPWRKLQKKLHPLDAGAPPRTCGPTPPWPSPPPPVGCCPRPGRSRPRGLSLPRNKFCPPVPRFLLRPRPCPQATASSQVGPYMTRRNPQEGGA